MLLEKNTDSVSWFFRITLAKIRTFSWLFQHPCLNQDFSGPEKWKVKFHDFSGLLRTSGNPVRNITTRLCVQNLIKNLSSSWWSLRTGVAPPDVFEMIKCGCARDTPCSTAMCGCYTAILPCTKFRGCHGEAHCRNEHTRRVDDSDLFEDWVKSVL